MRTTRHGDDVDGDGSALPGGPVTARRDRAPATLGIADTTRQDLLVEAARRLGRDAALADLDDTALADAVTTGAAELAAATARWLAALAELVVRGVWARDGARTPAVWLSWACGIGASTAREHVRVALRLRDCPLVAERFAAGRLSYSKVRAITRVCTPEIEPMLLAWADSAPAAVLERIVADARRVQRATEATTDRDDLGATARWREDGTYELVVRTDAATGVAMDQHLDRLVELADATRPDPSQRPASSDARVPDGQLEVGDALEVGDQDATHGQQTGTDAPEAPGQPGPRSTPRPPGRAQRRADAIVGALAAAVAAGPSDTSGADRHTIVLHVPADALSDELASDLDRASRVAGGGSAGGTAATAGTACGTALDAAAAGRGGPHGTAGDGLTRTRTAADHPTTRPAAARAMTSTPEVAVLTDDVVEETRAEAATRIDGSDTAGGPSRRARTAAVLVRDGRGRVRALSIAELRRAACAPRVLVTVHGDGSPADLGRTRREPDARLRRLLLARDGTCRFPGCGATQHLHAHHVVWWANGGPTDLDNLLLLCRHHHAVVHDDGWRLQPAGRGRWTFHPPAGHPAGDGGPWPSRAPATGASAAAVALAAAVHAPDITPSSLRPPHWDGERHDHDLAVGVLLERTTA